MTNTAARVRPSLVAALSVNYGSLTVPALLAVAAHLESTDPSTPTAPSERAAAARARAEIARRG